MHLRLHLQLVDFLCPDDLALFLASSGLVIISSGSTGTLVSSLPMGSDVLNSVKPVVRKEAYFETSPNPITLFHDTIWFR